MILLLAIPPLVGLALVGGWPHVFASLVGCLLGWIFVRRHERRRG